MGRYGGVERLAGWNGRGKLSLFINTEAGLRVTERASNYLPLVLPEPAGPVKQSLKSHGHA